MTAILFILALAAAFIGTIFAFRAVKRIHDGLDYNFEATACAACVTFVLFVVIEFSA